MRKGYFNRLPIQSKITLLIMAITGAALLLFTTLLLAYQFRILKQSMVKNLEVVTGAISRLSPGPLSDREWEATEEVLLALKEDEDIEGAAIYSLDNDVFVVYHHSAAASSIEFPERVEPEGHQFFKEGGAYKLSLTHPIVQEGRPVGTMYVVSNLNRLKRQVYNTFIILVVTMGLFLVAAQLAAFRMQRNITRPVFSLARTARQITEIGDYSIRVERTSGDEIGDLIDDFNTMLDAIQVRDSELHQHRHNLELIVEERTEELRAHRDEALAAAQAKAEFLANMSHEIRTPMNGVVGVLSLLKGAPLTEEYSRLLETASRSADSLMYIINDILDFSKIDAGMVEFESIPFDVRELMEETASLYADAVNSKDLEILCFIPRDVHCYVEGDPTRLRQILTNLVSNAVKFTASGQVVLRVERLETRGDKQLLRFSVIDTGIGVPEPVLPRLFDKFIQADGSTTRNFGGTGLGLSVCKQLVELQGGDIGVYSREGNGSEFWFTLQLRLVPASEVTALYEVLEGRHFLVIDDNATNRMILEHYLDLCDTVVESCGSAAEALQMLEGRREAARRVDTVLIDYQMPGCDGFTCAREVLSHFGASAPQLYLLSSGSIGMEEARRAGFEAVVYKPVRRNQLYDVLAGRLTVEPEKERREEKSRGQALSGSVLLVDDEPINQKVALAILERLGLDADLAANGLEAVQRLETKTYDAVLMDIQMPDLSGYEATEIIRRMEREHSRERVTIIAMTANALESAKARCLEVGMDDFISKPIKPDVLASRLKPWLPRRTAPAAPGGGPAGEEETADSANAALWNRHRALELIEGDESLLNDLIGLFIARKEIMLERIRESVSSRDASRLDDAAHAYKSAVGHLGVESLRRLVLELEMKGKSGNMTGSEALLEKIEAMSDLLLEELRLFSIQAAGVRRI